MNCYSRLSYQSVVISNEAIMMFKFLSCNGAVRNLYSNIKMEIR
jgi:hypothetical protein